jgi:hypothetical protein
MQGTVCETVFFAEALYFVLKLYAFRPKKMGGRDPPPESHRGVFGGSSGVIGDIEGSSGGSSGNRGIIGESSDGHRGIIRGHREVIARAIGCVIGAHQGVIRGGVIGRSSGDHLENRAVIWVSSGVIGGHRLVIGGSSGDHQRVIEGSSGVIGRSSGSSSGEHWGSIGRIIGSPSGIMGASGCH